MVKETQALRVAVAGGGSWGTALGHQIALCGHSTRLVLRDADVAHSIRTRHENPRYLAGYPLCPALQATTDPQALAGQDVVVLAIPCQQVRAYLRAVRPLLSPGAVLVNAAKGLEADDCITVGQIVAQELADLQPHYAILSGPSFAVEVIKGHPTAVVLGCQDKSLGARLRAAFSSPRFRCYSSTDVVGVELGGALKNVMAIAAGVSDGLGFGHNARAALITRGLAEISRIGSARGARPLTFMGLSGLGDLTLTCTGDLSRNRQVGLRLGQGESLAQIVASLGMVAEGVKTTQAVHALATSLHVAAPITAAVHRILYENYAPRDAVAELMARELKEE